MLKYLINVFLKKYFKKDRATTFQLPDNAVDIYREVEKAERIDWYGP